MPGHPIMAALDADKDGALSADEIAKAPEALKMLDKNDDGKLTDDELRPPRRPDGPGEFGRGPRGDGPSEFGRRPRGDGPLDGPPDGRRRGRDFPPPDARDRGPRRGPPHGDEARGPHILPPGAREHLDLSDEQIEKIDALEKEVQGKVEEILNPEQLERLAHMFRRGPDGPGGPGGRERFRGRPDGPPEPPDRPRRPRPPRD